MCTAPRLSIPHPYIPRRRHLMYRQLRKVVIGHPILLFHANAQVVFHPPKTKEMVKKKKCRCNDLLLWCSYVHILRGQPRPGRP